MRINYLASFANIGKGIKKLTDGSIQEKRIIKAIKNDIAIYAAHTNLNNLYNGVNKILCNNFNNKY